MYNFTGIYSNKSVVIRPSKTVDALGQEQTVVMLLPTLYTYTTDENNHAVVEPLGDVDKKIIIEFYDYLQEQIKTGVLSVYSDVSDRIYSDIVNAFNERNSFILSLDGPLNDIESLCWATNNVEIGITPFVVDTVNKTYRIAIQTVVNK